MAFLTTTASALSLFSQLFMLLSRMAKLFGVPVFFLLKSSENLSLAALGMMAVMLPLFFLAMYEKDGQPLEVVAKHFYEAKFKRPKTRPYKTKNYYALLVQQADVEMEVNRIVQNGKKQERQSGAGISITAAMTRQRSFLRRVWRRNCC